MYAVLDSTCRACVRHTTPKSNCYVLDGATFILEVFVLTVNDGLTFANNNSIKRLTSHATNRPVTYDFHVVNATLSHAHTHARARAHAHARTHTSSNTAVIMLLKQISTNEHHRKYMQQFSSLLNATIE